MTMKAAISAITATLSIGSMAFARSSSAAPKHTSASASTAPELRITMRKLWEDHITYTRNYIISALADLLDVDAVAKRLLRNQNDIGDAIAPYYGPAAGKNWLVSCVIIF